MVTNYLDFNYTIIEAIESFVHLDFFN